MTATTLVPTNVTTEPGLRRRPTLPEVLVVGGAALAPLNLLIVGSLTVYDVLLGVALVILVLRRALLMPDRPIMAAFLVFLVGALLSTFRATYAIESLTQVLQYVFIGFVQLPVVLSVVRTRRLAVTSVLMLCLGTLLAILHASITQQTQGAGRVLVFYSDNPNRLGYPVVYLLPLLMVLWWYSRRGGVWQRRLATLACLGGGYLSIWALFASASRSSLLGALVALAVFVVLRPGQGIRRILVRFLALTAALTVVTAALVSSGALPNTLEDRIMRSLDSEPDDQAGLISDREHLAEAGVAAFYDSPFLGTGLDNFRYVTTNYDLDATPQLPHNLWLQLLVQVGLVGTLAFAAILVLWFWDVRRAYNVAARDDRLLLWGLASAMAGVMTISLFIPELLDRHYWLLVALGLAVATGARSGRVGRKLENR